MMEIEARIYGVLADDIPARTGVVTSQSLTRVIAGDCELDLAQLQGVLERIHRMLPVAPAAEREYMAKALLALAISSMFREGACFAGVRPVRSAVGQRRNQTVTSTLLLRPED